MFKERQRRQYIEASSIGLGYMAKFWVPILGPLSHGLDPHPFDKVSTSSPRVVFIHNFRPGVERERGYDASRIRQLREKEGYRLARAAAGGLVRRVKMPFCGKCGAEVLLSHRYCRSCGAALPHETDAQSAHLTIGATPQTLPYQISLTRVLIMGVLSHGSYLIYWFYLTWKQYREHTRSEAYPVWHALTLFVPIYSLFRTHAHVRAFKELMLNAGLSTNLSVGGAVLLMFIYWVVSIIGLADAWGSGGFSGELTQGAALVSTVTGLISIAIVTWFVVHVQGSLNQYWASLKNVKAVNTNIGIGEVLFALLGLLSWGLTVANLAK